jgi:hypothetical protein
MQNATIRDDCAPDRHAQRGYCEVAYCVNDGPNPVYAWTCAVLRVFAVSDTMRHGEGLGYRSKALPRVEERLAEEEAVAAIIRITGGKFRLLHRFFM